MAKTSSVFLKSCGLLVAVLFLSACFGTRARSEQVSAFSFPEKGSLEGAEQRVLVHNNVKRSYLIQPVKTGAGPFPVIVVLHGGGSMAEKDWEQTSLPTIGKRDGFIVVFPQGINKHWNDGRGTTVGGAPSTADDIGFLRALIASVVQQDRGDPSAVFMIGVSNGGFMTMRYACAHAEDLRAAGQIVSNFPAKNIATCRPAKPLPWLSINATEDPLVDFKGQTEGTVKNGRPQPATLSADETFAFWADRAGCAVGTTSEKLPRRDSSQKTWVERRMRKVCADGATSVYYIMHGSGHGYPNMMAGLLYRAVAGRPSNDIDAGTVIWDFFKSTLPR